MVGVSGISSTLVLDCLMLGIFLKGASRKVYIVVAFSRRIKQIYEKRRILATRRNENDD